MVDCMHIIQQNITGTFSDSLFLRLCCPLELCEDAHRTNEERPNLVDFHGTQIGQTEFAVVELL